MLTTLSRNLMPFFHFPPSKSRKESLAKDCLAKIAKLSTNKVSTSVFHFASKEVVLLLLIIILIWPRRALLAQKNSVRVFHPSPKKTRSQFSRVLPAPAYERQVNTCAKPVMGKDFT